MTDLHRDDFEVLEAGIPQEVTHFSVESFDASFVAPSEIRPPSQEPLPAPGAAERTIVVMVDDLHTSVQNMIGIKKALAQFVNQEIRDDDQVVFVTTSGSLGFLQQLTSERAVMRLAVERLTGQASPISSPLDRPYLTPYQAEQIARGDRPLFEAAVNELRAEEPQNPNPEDLVNAAVQRILAQVDQWSVATLSTLDATLRSLQRQSGSKMAILISEGVLLTTNSSQARSQLQQVIDAATRAGVVVYTIDPRGLETDALDLSTGSQDRTEPMRILRQTNQAAERLALQETLQTIAKQTGGEAFLNRNDLKVGFQNVLLKNNFYYSLGYQPAESKHGKAEFQPIEVRVKGRTDVQVRFQRGYLIAQPEKPKQNKTKDDPKTLIQQALHSMTPYRQIGLTGRANFINVASPGSLVVAAFQIDAHTLQFNQIDDRRQTTVDIVGLVYNARGDVAHSFSKTLSLNLRQQTYDRLLNQGLQYTEQFQPSPGLYQIRIALREQSTGHVGSLSQWVEVPDLSQNRLVLSDIFFVTGAPNMSPDAGGNAAQMADDPKLTIPAWCVFPQNSRLDFGFYVYNASQAAGQNPDLVVQVQIVRNNAPVFTSPLRVIPVEESTDLKHIFYGSRVLLGLLAPGKYLLQVIVIDRSNRQNAVERIDFTVI